MGADNFGPLGAANRVTVSPATRGSNGGEERHTMTAAETAAHSHPASSGTESVDHSHSGSTDTQGNHWHSAGAGGLLSSSDNGVGGFFAASGGGGTVTAVWFANTNTTGAHSHGVSTGGRSAAHTHAITVSNNTGGGSSHQNLQPYEADNYLVRIA
jgi:microcystin-dependent protein